MTSHQNNLENITPIVVVDIYDENDDAFADKAYCIMATMDADLVEASPLPVAEISEQLDDVLADKTYCVMATIDI